MDNDLIIKLTLPCPFLAAQRPHHHASYPASVLQRPRHQERRHEAREHDAVEGAGPTDASHARP